MFICNPLLIDTTGKKCSRAKLPQQLIRCSKLARLFNKNHLSNENKKKTGIENPTRCCTSCVKKCITLRFFFTVNTTVVRFRQPDKSFNFARHPTIAESNKKNEEKRRVMPENALEKSRFNCVSSEVCRRRLGGQGDVISRFTRLRDSIYRWHRCTFNDRNKWLRTRRGRQARTE